ncbi:MAG TPA: serine/threonine-protein kinase [Verrucomicrobiae bacterium]|nr:serine/threonine-protein kinase [Verrucomicrobiae bacterium]
MDAETIREQELFDAALPLANAEERHAFLDRACDGDPDLRSRVAKLLAAHTHSEVFFQRCISDFATVAHELRPGAGADSFPNLSEEMIGTSVGRYKLLKTLGEGGCGVVYLAEQAEPVRRRVALKIIKLGMDTQSVIARFDAERQALALMDHPNIAKVLDAGATEAGRPYFVMELVDGIRITRYCDENHLTLAGRLNLFVQVCQAIQHAHQKGVLHRDIKPSNILIALHDGLPVPKVIDFGIAKAIEGRLTGETTYSYDGQLIGTPAYMSPEQAELNSVDIDTRSDIYSLGVLLYELLTSRTPFDQKNLLRLGLDEMRRTLREDEPRRPSGLLATLTHPELTIAAAQRRIEPFRLVKALTGELDWIVMKTLEKDRRRRYETANALAMDIRRFLNSEPVLACPPSRIYRFQKLVSRNKVIFASGAIVLLTLLVGLGISTRFYFKERDGRIEQTKLRQIAETARASEFQLQKEVEAREKITQASVLLSHGAMEQADALIDPIPAKLFSPSSEATVVFRSLGDWNLLQARWQKAADRYAVVVQVNQVDRAELSTVATTDLLVAQPLLIEAGDIPGYERSRKMVLARLAGTPFAGAAEQLLKTSLLLPADESIMKMMPPLENLIISSVKNYDVSQNENLWILATWRTFALALLEYRRGNFNASMDWLEKCSAYPDQTPSCVASAHILRSMNEFQLGETTPAQAELAAGKSMVDGLFAAKLELGDNKTGRLGGWIMARIFLREAKSLADASIDFGD